MASCPDWLPGFLSVDGDNFIDGLCCKFAEDAFGAGMTYLGKRVRMRMEPKVDGRPEGFWHCVSQGGSQGPRVIDKERGKRLAWIKPVLQHLTDPRVQVWTEGNEHVIWFREEYLIVVAERGDDGDGNTSYFLLKTAYTTLTEEEKTKKRKRRDAARKNQRRP